MPHTHSPARPAQLARTRMRRGRRGFSLLEILIVVSIILLLAGLTAYTLFGQQASAMGDTCRTQLMQLRTSLDAFQITYKRYPTEEEGLAVLWNKELLDPEADTDKWNSYTRDPVPNDPWGNTWVYRAESETEGRPFDLSSNGADGEEGTDDDISVWDTVASATGEEGGSEDIDFGP